MMTRAFVLHLWQRVALGGKLVPSPVMEMSSCEAGSTSEACSLAFAGAGTLTLEQVARVRPKAAPGVREVLVV